MPVRVFTSEQFDSVDLNSTLVLLGASKAASHGICPDAGQNAPKMRLASSGGWVSCEWTLEPIAYSTYMCVVYSSFVA